MLSLSLSFTLSRSDWVGKTFFWLFFPPSYQALLWKTLQWWIGNMGQPVQLFDESLCLIPYSLILSALKTQLVPPWLKFVCKSPLYELRLVQMVTVLIKMTLKRWFLFSKAKQEHFKKETGSYYDFGGFYHYFVKRYKSPSAASSTCLITKNISKTFPETDGYNCCLASKSHKNQNFMKGQMF